MRRWIGILLIGVAVVAAGGAAAYVLTPWPKVLFIRYAFAKDATARNAALEKHEAAAVDEQRDIRYAEGKRTLLDVFRPAGAGGPLPVVVWVHGGAFVAGDKSDLTPYLKILAGRGYTAVGVGYTRAPEGHYPTPVREANEALAFLLKNAEEMRIDPNRILLAGDSAGAQIVAQLAAIISDPAYAETVGIDAAIERGQLKGVVLFCGVYDASLADYDGAFGGFLRTVMWSYFGTKDFLNDPRMAEMSVNRHVTADYPPAFVSAGNADPLAPQSALMAKTIAEKGVAVDTLFFPADYSPPLPHEYQFNLDEAAGSEALERLTAFLGGLAQ
jgi:acetyl esterase/lipase